MFVNTMTTVSKLHSALGAEPPALRLARYLREFVRHRTTVVREVDHYEEVLWFADMPQQADCRSEAWEDGETASNAWLEVKKQVFEPVPEVPQVLAPWVDEQEIARASREMPPLRQSIPVPDGEDEHGEGETPRPVTWSLSDHPEVQAAYEQYRAGWESWADERLRREAVQRVYADLFRLRTQVLKQGEIVEVVLGLGLLECRAGPSIRRHVVVANVELTFNAAGGVIRVEPPGEGARLRIEDEMLDGDRRPDQSDHAIVEEQLAEIGDEIWDMARMHAALRTWTQAFGADAQWQDDLRAPVRGRRTAVTFAPALILRKRTQTGMRRIYDELLEQLANDAIRVPAGWQALVEDVGIGVSVGEEAAPRDAQSSGGAGREVYFPLPANLEQRQIVEAIERQRGVLVQGPPGTGKSHTIANLICHLLATGQRVLVTAETPQALRVVKDKLPDELQALCVSLLGQGGDAFAELNGAVQGITTRQASWSSGMSDRYDEIERDLESARRRLARTDSELQRLRVQETSDHSIAGGTYGGTASAIARRVASERERYQWLQLADPADCVTGRAPLSNAEMIGWLEIVRRYDGHDIAQAELRTPRSVDLVPPGEFSAAVAAERDAAAAVAGNAAARSHTAYGALRQLDPAARTEIGNRLRRLEERRRVLVGHDGWLRAAIRDGLAGRTAQWREMISCSRELLSRVKSLHDGLRGRTISLPNGADPRKVRADVTTALDHLDAGGRWKRLGLFTPPNLRGVEYLKDSVRVDGAGASDSLRLRAVRDYLDAASALDDLRKTWAGVDASPLPDDARQALAVASERCSELENGLGYADECRSFAGAMAALPQPVPAPDWLSGEAGGWRKLIDAVALERRYEQATRAVCAAAEALNGLRGLHDTHRVVAVLDAAVERRDVSAYSEGCAEVVSVEKLRSDQHERRRIEEILNSAAPGLADRVVASAGEPKWSRRFGVWEDAWRRAVADLWLRRRDDFSSQQQLEQSRRTTEGEIRKLLTEAAALCAWERFFERLSATQTAALRGWREAVRAMGKGTGRSGRLARLRREARDYMDECRAAIPVWIMPRYLVAEMVNPQPELYDVVIVDEASQLCVDSAFLFYVAKKMVIVGDDQQISPYGIGIPDDATAELQRRYLDGIPHRHALSPQSSLYGNANIRFGGRNVVLREHFRCMPEIIQFSNELCYAPNGTPLDPLRAYPPNRLEPLVVRRVPDGYRTGGVQARNPPEAEAVVRQVVACLADPRYANATMGVVSLQGDAQARLIERRLLEQVAPEVIEERRLVCGDAYAFQGDERDVVFLSMVAAERDENGERQRIGTLAHESARQRFNVAASRARDQLWLFHTVDVNSLGQGCMRRRLLEYVLAPRRQSADEQEQQFESPFERDVFQRIMQRGFRVRIQVAVGNAANSRYRIDLVVEGTRGRLAVECDGERWHGPERYEKDMARQRDLERAGWQFVRIRGSAFYRDPDRALAPLWAELERLEIFPGGGRETEQDLQPLRRAERPASVVDRDDGERRAPTQAPTEQHAEPAAGQDDRQYGLPADRDAGSAAAVPPRARRDEETEELDWDDVERFFHEYGCVMMDHPELRWYQESWGALMRCGLAGWTRFEDHEHAQTLLKLRAICLLAMYLGIYQQGSVYGPELGGCFLGHPGIWEYLEALKVDDESLWEMARIGGYLPEEESGSVEEHDDEEAEDEDERAEILRDVVPELIREENASICKALEAHYGGTVGLFESLWNSRLPLHRVDPHEDLVNPTLPPNAGLDYLLTSPELGEMAEVYDYVESGMRNWELDSSC